MSVRWLSAGKDIKDDLKPFYALGVNMAIQAGDQIKELIVTHEKDALMSGFADYMHGNVTTHNIHELMMEHGSALQKIIGGRMSAVAADKRQKNEGFIANYLAKNPGAVKTESGLVYHERSTGTGVTPSATSTVTTHYHGTLIDGTVFDSSVKNGNPISFSLQQVIKGWQEGIAMMKVGGKATLVCPPDLAYGDQGSPPTISGGSTLVFEVELIDCK